MSSFGRLHDLLRLLDPPPHVGHRFAAVGGLIGLLQVRQRERDDLGAELPFERLRNKRHRRAQCSHSTGAPPSADESRGTGRIATSTSSYLLLGNTSISFPLPLPAGDRVPFMPAVGQSKQHHRDVQLEQALQLSPNAHRQVNHQDPVRAL